MKFKNILKYFTFILLRFSETLESFNHILIAIHANCHFH